MYSMLFFTIDTSEKPYTGTLKTISQQKVKYLRGLCSITTEENELRHEIIIGPRGQNGPRGPHFRWCSFPWVCFKYPG